MFVQFFTALKSAGVPVTLREYLTLMEAMDKDLAGRRVEDFYYLSRAALVKDERNLDKFDRVFGHVFKGLELLSDGIEASIPEEWLKKYGFLARMGKAEEDKIRFSRAQVGLLDSLLADQPSVSLDQTFIKEVKGGNQLAGVKLLGDNANLKTEDTIIQFLAAIQKQRAKLPSKSRKYDTPYFIDTRYFGLNP